MVNFGPLAAEIVSGVWGSAANFNGFRVLASLLQRRRLWRPTKLCTMFGRLLHWYTIYTLSVAQLPLTEFCPMQNSLCVHVLRSPILAALGLLQSTPAAGVSQTLRCGARNGITELSQS